MLIAERIKQLIKELKPSTSAVIKNDAHIYNQLGFDSIEFVELILMIEKEFFISINLMEMEVCLKLDKLTMLVESKISLEYANA